MSVLDVVADHGRCKNLAYKLVSFPWALLLCGFSWKMKSFESDCTPLSHPTANLRAHANNKAQKGFYFPHLQYTRFFFTSLLNHQKDKMRGCKNAGLEWMGGLIK